MTEPAQLCSHLYADTIGPLPFRQIMPLAFFNGLIDGLVKCQTCDTHAILELLDWGGIRHQTRIYSMAALAAEDVALFLRNTSKAYCDLSRHQQELHALFTCAAPPTRVIACDVGTETLLANQPYPAQATLPKGEWESRLPPPEDMYWFGALALQKRLE